MHKNKMEGLCAGASRELNQNPRSKFLARSRKNSEIIQDKYLKLSGLGQVQVSDEQSVKLIFFTTLVVSIFESNFLPARFKYKITFAIPNKFRTHIVFRMLALQELN